MKLTNNIEKLLKILVVFVGFLCTIFVFGVLTRDRPVRLEHWQASPIVESVKVNRSRQIREQLLTLQVRYFINRVEVLQAKLKAVEEKAETISSLTPMQRYINYAYEISDKYYPEIHAEYVCAIIYHESRFDPTVTNSKTGVKGLCQISPKWHAKRAANLGVTDLYDPYGNILVCFDILNELTLSNSFSYALDFYAGGYPYANRYRGKVSPFAEELAQIMNEQNFAQYVLPYDIT